MVLFVQIGTKRNSMNIFFGNSQANSVAFTSRVPKKLQKANELYLKLGKDIADDAYCSGIPKIMALTIIDRSKINDVERLSQFLPEQFKAIFNLIKSEKNISTLKEVLKVPADLIVNMLKSHERVLTEQKMISEYMSEHVSMEKIGKRYGLKSTHTWDIFAKWKVPNLSKRNYENVAREIPKGLSNAEIAEISHIREFSVARWRRALNYPTYRDGKISSRNPQILERVINGARREDVAKEFGLAKGTIDRIVQAHNGTAKKIEKRDLAIVERIKSGDRYVDIAKEFNVSKDTVKRIAKKYNCKRRKS